MDISALENIELDVLAMNDLYDYPLSTTGSSPGAPLPEPIVEGEVIASGRRRRRRGGRGRGRRRALETGETPVEGNASPEEAVASEATEVWTEPIDVSDFYPLQENGSEAGKEMGSVESASDDEGDAGV